MTELATGLEASNQPFLWVVHSDDNSNNGWAAPEGWERRVAGRGMVVRGWVPQLAVLAHPSVGARVWGGGKRSVRYEEAQTVPAEAIARAGGPVHGARRGREKAEVKARELAERARVAVAEDGSSWRDIHRLIDDLLQAWASPPEVA
jgi:hypothetical protein